jgi:hypothetical protein
MRTQTTDPLHYHRGLWGHSTTRVSLDRRFCRRHEPAFTDSGGSLYAPASGSLVRWMRLSGTRRMSPRT